MKIALFLTLTLLTASTLGAIVGSYIDESGRQIDHHVGSYLVRDVSQALYRVKYDVEMLGGNFIVNLDVQQGVAGVQCDISNIELIVTFTNKNDAYAFYRVMSASSSDRFVTGTRWNCNEAQSGAMMLMRRVLGASFNNDRVVTLNTAQGQYEESIKDGVITLDKAEEPEDHSLTFCLGVNSNKECDAAKEPIPLYTNKYMSLSCSNCFVGAKATVFLEVQISWFKLRKIATGLKDISVNAGLVLDLNAQAAWNAGIDKTYKVVDQAIIIQFWIGPIPITIWYEIPIQLLASASIDAKLDVQAGATANWKIGDAYVSWSESQGWQMAKPNPVFTWQPVLKAEGNFNAQGSLAIIPSFVVHAMRIMQMGVKMTPSLMLEAHGDLQKKEACADLSYRVNGEASAEVHINIPYIRIRLDKVFGPYSLFDTGIKQIAHWCVKG